MHAPLSIHALDSAKSFPGRKYSVVSPEVVESHEFSHGNVPQNRIYFRKTSLKKEGVKKKEKKTSISRLF